MKKHLGSALALMVPALVVLATSHGAEADQKVKMSLRDRQSWDEKIANLEKNAANASTKCGSRISVKVDVASFGGGDPDKHRLVHCRDAINTLSSLCELRAGSKEPIQKAVSNVTCRRGTTGVKSTLAGKTLFIDIDGNKSVDGSWSSVIRETIPAPSPAAGDPPMTLRERQEWDERAENLDKSASSSSKLCETTITAKWDVPSFRGQDLGKTHATAKCRDAVLALGAACRFSAAGKRAVQKSVAAVTCHRSTSGTRYVPRANKQLTVELDPSKAVSGSWKTALEGVL